MNCGRRGRRTQSPSRWLCSWRTPPMDQLFAGSLVRLPSIRHSIVRIYTSSTYTDMAVEKHVLVNEAYPKAQGILQREIWLRISSNNHH